MNPEKEKELKASLNSLLTDLEAYHKKKIEVVAMAEMWMPVGNYPDFSVVEKAIKVIKTINSISDDDLKIAKKLLELEEIFMNSSTLENYKLPNFWLMMNFYTLMYAGIENEIDKLQNKTKNLIERSQFKAAEEIFEMCLALRNLDKEYLNEEKFDCDTYKTKALGIINEHRHELNKHRGCKQILGNLLILIATLGVAQLANKAINGKFLFFKTDSAQKIESFINTLNCKYQM